MRHSFLKTTFDPDNFKTYHANCHCGAIRYKADVSPPLPVDGGDHEVVTCDDSLCMRTGSLNVYIPVDKVTWIQGEDKLKSYDYLRLSRNFCPDCGIQMTSTLTDRNCPAGEVVALNVRAFQDIDYDKVKIVYVSMKDVEPFYDVDAIPGK